MDARLWDPIVPELARRHSVVRFDARGLGRSTPPREPFNDMQDLIAVLDHFGLEQAALVGLSAGGETSLDLALAHPARISALALLGTSVSGYTWPQDPDTQAYAAARRDRDAARLAELELSIWAPLGVTAPGGELIEAMVADNAQRRVISEHHLTIATGPDAIDHLDQINVPTLVLHGDHDHPQIARIAHKLIADIPGARGETLTGADHYLPLRVPERLTELLLAHLPSHSDQQPTIHNY